MLKDNFFIKEYKKIINNVYKKNIINFFGNLNFVLGIVGGFAIVYIIFDNTLNLSKRGILLASLATYIISLLIIFLIFFIKITFKIYNKPEQMIKTYSNDSRDFINDLLSNSYGVKILQRKDISYIDEGGGVISNLELKLSATVENFRAIEIFAMSLTEEKRKLSIDERSFYVSPNKYGPISLTKSTYKRGFYILQFSQELTIGEEILISYKLIGAGKILALTLEDYLPGIPFEYSSHKMAYPVKILTHEINFEEGYPIDVVSDRPNVIVWYGDAHVEHKAETKRAEESFNFSRRKAVLELKNPILGLQYVIRWTVCS